MTVYALNRDQLDELKAAYFWGDDYDPAVTTAEGLPVLFPGDIPDRVIFSRFAGVDFVPEDFFVSAYAPAELFDSDAAEWEHMNGAQ